MVRVLTNLNYRIGKQTYKSDLYFIKMIFPSQPSLLQRTRRIIKDSEIWVRLF